MQSSYSKALSSGILALTVLAVAVALQVNYSRREVPIAYPGRKAVQALPSSMAGWKVSDLPLGPTEAASGAALAGLNLTDFAYREFQRGDLSFTLFVAYWPKGRMATRLVASHTPDRCWTENGMRCIAMSFRQCHMIDGRKLLPCEQRIFVQPGGEAPIHVVYWHSVEGRAYDYGGRFNAVPHPWLWWKDTFAQAAYGSREQVFVRVASLSPFDVILRDAQCRSLLSQVADLGLWDPPTG